MRIIGVSRTVVREAISHMQAAGLVETRHGIGTFVLEPPAPAATLGIDPNTIITMRDTPMMRMISDSVGNLSPGDSVPSRILSEMWATTPWARLRCFLGGAEGRGDEFMMAMSAKEDGEKSIAFSDSADYTTS